MFCKQIQLLSQPKDGRKCLHGNKLDKEEVGKTGKGLCGLPGSLTNWLISASHWLEEQEDW